MSDDISVQVSGQLSFDEYYRHHKIVARIRRLIIQLIFFAVAFDSFYKFYTYYPERFLSTQLWLGIILCLYALIISPLLFKWRCHRLWNKYPLIQDPFTYTINKQGFTAGDSDEPIIEWDKIIKIKEKSGLFIFFVSPINGLILPARCMEEQEQHNLRELINKKSAA